jgi:hypothetical protein
MQPFFTQKRKYFVHVVAGYGARSVCYGFIKLFFVVYARSYPRLHPA